MVALAKKEVRLVGEKHLNIALFRLGVMAPRGFQKTFEGLTNSST